MLFDEFCLSALNKIPFKLGGFILNIFKNFWKIKKYYIITKLFNENMDLRKKTDTYIIPWNLDESLKELLRWNFWKENHIEIFMKHFEDVKNSNITSLQELKKILAKESKLRHKNLDKNFAAWMLFEGLENDFQQDFIQKFAQESREERRNDVELQKIREDFFKDNPRFFQDAPKEFLDENPNLKKLYQNMFKNP